MKINEVSIGMTCWTKIGERRILVRVTRQTEPSMWSKVTRFHVRREDNGKDLPKSRAASALHATEFGK